MKKLGVFLFALVICLTFVSAQNCTTSSNCSSNQNCVNGICVDSSSSPNQQQNLSKIEKGFECLENQVKGKCSSLSIPEIAFTLLATPKSEIIDECKSALNSKKSSSGDCWPSGSCTIKDTALAVLALNHLNENTDAAESWLLAQNRTATDLIWYLEQDSNEPTQCKISYSGNDYTVNVADNKKLDSGAGSCLNLAQSNFWLQVSQDCYNKEFAVSCNKDFIATFLYKYSNSGTIFVLSDTSSQPAFGTINLKINTKCFGINSCDYESSLWATLALLQTNHNVDNFVPYLIALAEANEKYLPNSFLYLITDYDDYGNKLIQDQKLGNYWEADLTPYNKFYDSALALISLRNSVAEQVTKAKDWALFSQSQDGCWKYSDQAIIRDTAIILWALTGRAYSSPTSGGGTTYCTQASYFCLPTADCPLNQKLSNYFCSGLSTVCCSSENLKTCSEYLGEKCSSDEICSGNTRKTSDAESCCLGSCETRPTTSECEQMGYICKSSCSDNQEETSYSCSSGVCCRASTIPPSTSRWWIWVLIILIILVLAALAFLFRDKFRLFWFKFRNKFKKDKSSGSMQGFPPRPGPGFPPIRRQILMPRPMPPANLSRQAPPQPRDRQVDETFKRLREMSK